VCCNFAERGEPRPRRRIGAGTSQAIPLNARTTTAPSLEPPDKTRFWTGVELLGATLQQDKFSD
jgi:hypothetical protein